MISRNKCDCCQNEAHGRFVWGLYEEPSGIPRTTEMQVADLCSACSDELWSKIKGAVNAGLMHFAIPKLYEGFYETYSAPVHNRSTGEEGD